MRHSALAYVLISFVCVFLGCSNEIKVRHTIDHLVYTTPSLEEGVDSIESILGIRPVPGGRHPKFGTHNALLSLGESTYLEIIAPDTSISVPERGRLLGEFYDQPAKLSTWVMRTEDIEETFADATKAGIAIGSIEEGSREKPDGSVLSWKLSNPYALPMRGALPFLISWGDTPHPAKHVTRAGELISLEIYHPDTVLLRSKLDILGVNLTLVKASEFSLLAKIETERGVIELK